MMKLKLEKLYNKQLAGDYKDYMLDMLAQALSGEEDTENSELMTYVLLIEREIITLNQFDQERYKNAVSFLLGLRKYILDTEFKEFYSVYTSEIDKVKDAIQAPSRYVFKDKFFKKYLRDE